MTGKRFALLVGCNYTGTKDELRGCHTDVHNMHQALVNTFRFSTDDIEVQIDNPGSEIMPTGANIKRALYRIVGQARPGDDLFFLFSGHGTIVPTGNGNEEHEAIVPCDHNVITTVDFRHLVDQVPKGATFTMFSDSSLSGGLIGKEPVQIGPQQRNVALDHNAPANRNRMIPYETVHEHLSSITGMDDPNIGAHLSQIFRSGASLTFNLSRDYHPKPLNPDQGILLSGCQSNEYCQDGPANRGAFSYAVEMVFQENGGKLSNRNVVMLAREKLLSIGIYGQHPCLYCSDENADAVFLHA